MCAQGSGGGDSGGEWEPELCYRLVLDLLIIACLGSTGHEDSAIQQLLGQKESSSATSVLNV
eukprot:CAMPEP_0194743082 /NCGR_PEP_ID=MMETSP0296-20130528/100117_1 /TAXON_ID=39354 /ORGANISM="Heterosigma akashiwo, Strain CCMP2393" /LENGTH=61 /DNA_ID=CAMNT_0039655077 /DNA_START=2863 /DNA_END=3048 /DNA_ORIENTATION=+